MTSRATAKTLWQRWVIVEAYPLYAAIGAGIAACAFHLGRMALHSPDVNWDKKRRMSGFPDHVNDDTEGSKYYNHYIRKSVAGRHAGIFPPGKPRQEEE